MFLEVRYRGGNNMKESTLYKFQVGFTVILVGLTVGAIMGIFPREILHYQIPLVMWIEKR